VVLALPLLGLSYLFLRNSGELDSIEAIAAAQQRSEALYGTAIHANVYAYKMALLKERSPDIVAIGSSRVLELRAGDFSALFVNLGRTANYPDEAAEVVKDVMAVSHPKLILLAVDFWWFNPKMVFAFNFDTHRIRGGDLTSDALISPARWLLEGKLRTRAFLDMVAAGHPVKVGGVPMFGVQAITRGNGFAGDGSYYYLGTVYGRGPAEDPHFSDTFGRIARNTSQFVRAAAPDEQRLAAFATLVRRLERTDVRLITFMPPVAPSVLTAMQKAGGFDYIDSARRRIAEISSHHYDFHDARSIGAGDCEFIDGFHGGDVVAARILDRIAADQASGLAAYLNRHKVREIIDKDAGRALADDRYRQPGESEKDFLELGCNKH
jgi:hypothetical protein